MKQTQCFIAHDISTTGRIAFAAFCFDLGCYFAILIDGHQGDSKKQDVKLCLTLRKATEICENWLQNTQEKHHGQ